MRNGRRDIATNLMSRVVNAMSRVDAKVNWRDGRKQERVRRAFVGACVRASASVGERIERVQRIK